MAEGGAKGAKNKLTMAFVTLNKEITLSIVRVKQCATLC